MSQSVALVTKDPLHFVKLFFFLLVIEQVMSNIF